MTAKPTALGGRRPMLAGSAVGFSRNFPQYPVPQMLDVVAASSGTFTALYGGVLSIYVQGAGATGLASNGGGNKGGGGGGAAFKRIRITQGQKLPWVCGAGGAAVGAGSAGQNAGSDSTVTLPNGQVVKGGGADNAGNGGSGSGGDVNSAGGAGGASATLAGADGANGGATGGVGSANGGGGGGVGGLNSATSGFPNAKNGFSSGSVVGQGSGGNDSNTGTGAGQAGRVFMILQH